MRILVTGATGFVGRALCLRLERDGHRVVALVRDPERARTLLAAGVERLRLDPSAAGEESLAAEIDRCDAVVHLAGEPVIGKRWSALQKQRLADSRVALARRLTAAMARADRGPRVFVSSSAVGLYGNRGDEVLREDSRPGDDFLARLCLDWEAAAMEGARSGARVVLLRTGIVLGPGGGVLGAMELPFRLALGGRLGSGRQFVPWIHLDDLLEMFVRALDDPRLEGAFNATAPEPVTNLDFTRALADAVGRPALLPVPAFALRLLLGEAGAVLLAGQRAVPARFLAAGFRFAHPELGLALRSLLGNGAPVRIEAARDVPDHPYLRSRPPTHALLATTRLDAPLESVALFFSSAENLGSMTPSSMRFRIETPLPIAMARGTRIQYTIRLGPLPLSWLTVIEEWNGAEGFADAQHRGPYRCWWHEHRFRRGDDPAGHTTLMEDRVLFSAPLPGIGRLLVRWMIAPQLRRIFAYRARAMAWRFGVLP